MPRHLPIACTLDATDLARRESSIAHLGRDALVSATHDGTHADVRFAAGVDIRARVDAFVAGERACCAFLVMHVVEHADSIVLTIDVPAGAELALAELVAAFQSEPPAG